MEHAHETSSQSGRKGIAYDWQDVYVAAQMAEIDHELGELLSMHG